MSKKPQKKPLDNLFAELAQEVPAAQVPVPAPKLPATAPETPAPEPLPPVSETAAPEAAPIPVSEAPTTASAAPALETSVPEAAASILEPLAQPASAVTPETPAPEPLPPVSETTAPEAAPIPAPESHPPETSAPTSESPAPATFVPDAPALPEDGLPNLWPPAVIPFQEESPFHLPPHGNGNGKAAHHGQPERNVSPISSIHPSAQFASSPTVPADPPPFKRARGDSPSFPLPAAADPSQYLFELLDDDPTRRWSEDERLLVTQVADQLNLALENAQLFQQTQSALDVLAVRERYQKGIAQAVAILSERGTAALTQVLGILGEAAAAQRVVYYAFAQEKSGPAWRLVGEWTQPPQVYQPLPLASRLPAADFPAFSRTLTTVGVVRLTSRDLIADAQLPEQLGVHEILALAVTGATRSGEPSFPGFLAFGQIDAAVVWGSEEIGALQTAAAALANTLAREDLLTQVQSSLAETEKLYATSRQLTYARDLQEIMRAIVSGVAIPAIDRGLLLYFERADQETIESLRVVAHWQQTGAPEPLPIGHRFTQSVLAVQTLLTSQTALFISDVSRDPRLDEAARLFLQSQKVRALALLPLWVGARQLGSVVLLAQQPHTFNENELRTYATLLGQAAAAVESRIFFEQTETALAETEDLYQASAELNSAAGYEHILEVLRRYSILGHAQAGNVSISLFDRPWMGSEKPTWYVPIARWSASAGLESPSGRFPIGDGATVEGLLHPDLPTLIDDPAHDPRLDAAARQVYLEQLQADQIIFSPLNVAGKWIGHIVAVYTQAVAFSESDLRRLISLTGQAAVAIESMRLLQETRLRNEELAALNQIIATANRSLDVPTMLHAILAQSLESLGYSAGWVTLLPESGPAHLVTSQGLPASLVAALSHPTLDDPFAQAVAQQGAPLHLYDLDVSSPLDRASSAITTPWLAAGYQTFIGTPLISKGRTLGVICTVSPESHREADPSLALMDAIGKQVGVAVENITLFEQTQSGLEETAALYAASAGLNEAQTFEVILTSLRDHTLLSRADRLIQLMLFDQPWRDEMPEWGLTLASLGTYSLEIASTRYPMRQFPSAATLLRANAPTLIENLADDSRLDANLRRLYLEQFQGHSALIVPLVVAGQWIGLINAVFGESQRFNEDEARRLMTVAGQAAVAVQNLHSVDLAGKRAQEAQRRSEELTLINRVVAAVSSSLDLQASMDVIARELGQALQVQTGIALLTDDGQALQVIANFSPFSDMANAIGIKLPLEGNRSSQIVFETKQTLVIENAQTNPLTAPIHEQMKLRSIQELMLVPLVAGNKVFGTVGLDIMTEGRKFSAEDRRLAETIVFQAAAAVQNSRLFAQTERALAETEALYQASAQINTASSFSDILQALRRFTLLGQEPSATLLNIFDRPWTSAAAPEWILLLAAEGSLVSAQANPRLRLSAFRQAAEFLSPSAPTLAPNISADPRFDTAMRTLLQTEYNAQSAIFFPLVVAGQWIGFLTGVYNQTTVFNEADLRLLRALSVQAAIAIQNLHLLEETRRRADQLQTAAEIARDTTSTLALDTLLQRTVALLRDRFNYYQVSIFLVDESGEWAQVQESTGAAGDELKRIGHRLAVGSRSVVGHATAEGEPWVVNDVTADPVHRPNPLLPLTRAELGIPLKIGNRVIGALDVQSTNSNAFTPEDVSVLQILADQVAVAVDNARSYALAQQAYEEMKEVDRLKSQFLANMSHELRTPLNSIIGFSRVILKGIDGPISDLQQQDLSAIYNSGQHLLGLINDVLDLSKIEAGKMELSFEEQVNLADLINSVMSTVLGLVKDKPIQLQRTISPDLPTVRADPMKVRQVLINLLSNAAKFTDQGVIMVEAYPQTNSEGQAEIMIRVIDSGPGIAPEDQEKLFQPFSQVDGSLTRKSGGSGLGLSICRHLIDMHGGRIGLESAEGQGSTFFFTLPILIPEPIFLDEPPVPVPGMPLILCVDDDKMILGLYARYLTKNGYQVHAVTDATQAVAQAAQLQPSAITLDVMMPGRDGWQVLQDLKANPATQQIPVLVCTLLEGQDTGYAAKAQSLGAAYLMKPILEEDLIEALTRLGMPLTQPTPSEAI